MTSPFFALCYIDHGFPSENLESRSGVVSEISVLETATGRISSGCWSAALFFLNFPVFSKIPCSLLQEVIYAKVDCIIGLVKLLSYRNSFE